MSYELTVATTNHNKLLELAVACPEALKLLPRPANMPEVIEGVSSLDENATLKAKAAVAALGVPALADDTGFFVDALGGEPGVLSARFAGLSSDGERRRRVLDLMRAVDGPSRGAHYETVLCLAFVEGDCLLARGKVFGTVAVEELGESEFGYDRIFVPSEGNGRTFGQMSRDEKTGFSHRGRAMRQLLSDYDDLIFERLGR